MPDKFVIDIPGTVADTAGVVAKMAAVPALMWAAPFAVPVYLVHRLITWPSRAGARREQQRRREERLQRSRDRREGLQEGLRRSVSAVLPWRRNPLREQVYDAVGIGGTFLEARGYR
jgi:hypothetical protein